MLQLYPQTRALHCRFHYNSIMGLLPDAQNCGLRMRRECRERFPHHRLQRNTLVSDPVMHRGTCLTHVSWCMSGSLTRDGGENVPGNPGVCTTRSFTYLARGPFTHTFHVITSCSLVLNIFLQLYIVFYTNSICNMPANENGSWYHQGIIHKSSTQFWCGQFINSSGILSRLH